MAPKFDRLRFDQDGNVSRAWEDYERNARGYIRSINSLPGVLVECVTPESDIRKTTTKQTYEGAYLEVRLLSRAAVRVEEAIKEL